MKDVIIPTWAEVNGWVALGVIVFVAFLVWAWHKGKEEESTVKWIRLMGARLQVL